MKITNRPVVVLVLGVLLATGVVTGLGVTAQNVFAQESPEAPILEELLSPPPPSNVPLTPRALDVVRKTTGKLYATFRGGVVSTATATVVASESKDMIITSGWPLINDRGERPTSVRFVPGEGYDAGPFTDAKAPFGTWTARTWATLPGYQRGADPGAQNNVGVVLLYTLNGKHIQEAVDAAQGLCFDCPRRGRVHVYAYHADHEGGATLDTTCQVDAEFINPFAVPFGTCLAGNPGLGVGSGGAAVIVDLDPDTGIGKVIAINTWAQPGPGGSRLSNGGAFLSRQAFALYEGYRRHQ